MHRTHPLRPQVPLAAAVLAAVFATASTTSTLAQSLPPMQPTTMQPQPPGAPAASLPPANPAHHAEITFAAGQLQVRADNSSLNQILRSISRQTGLKITGGVEDQRVFGNYGPGPISSILATLLDGTGTNVLLLGGGANTPPELQLTPRNGGASPPGPNSEAYAMYDDSVDKQPPVAPLPSPTASAQPEIHSLAGSPTIPQPLNAPIVGASHPAPAAAVLPAPAPNSAPASAAPAPNAAAPSEAAASTTPKHLTPEMVMQELLKMQAQKQAQKKVIQQQLDEQARQQQAQQQKKPKTQPPPSQPPASSTPPQ